MFSEESASKTLIAVYCPKLLQQNELQVKCCIGQG
jgi:hypothetical protein